MIKITFMGAESTVFAKNVLGDCMCTDSLRDCIISLYDIDNNRLKDSTFVVNAIQVGGYDPCTKIDFEIPKKYGLCHSVQCCSGELLNALGMQDSLEGRKELIAGINHMGWLLEIQDKNGKDLYPKLIEKYNISLDEYPRRCISQINNWNKQRDELLSRFYFRTHTCDISHCYAHNKY